MPMSLLLRCSSLEPTRRFYADVLGFDVSDSAEQTCTVKKAGATIVFTESDLWKCAPVMTGTVYFFLPDVDAYFAQVKDSADIAWPLTDMPYGSREFGLRDCNGYSLAFAQAGDGAQ